MITRLCLAAGAVLLLSVLGCASDPGAKPQWATSDEIDVAGLDTFGWADRGGKPPVTILDNEIRDAIRAQLTEKGYVESAESPDFLVSHETVEREAVEQGNPVRIGIGIGTWGGNVGGSVGTSVDVGEGDRVRQQLRIAVRALEAEDRREAWVGITAPLEPQPEAPAIDEAVAELMKEFPDRRR